MAHAPTILSRHADKKKHYAVGQVAWNPFLL